MEDPQRESLNTQRHDPYGLCTTDDLETTTISSPSVSCNGSEPLTAERTRKPPTITPRRFTRFFTPRSLSTGHTSQSKAGRHLRDITKNGINNGLCAVSPRSVEHYGNEVDESQSKPRKRRCRSIELLSSPPQSSPIKVGYDGIRNSPILETFSESCLREPGDNLWSLSQGQESQAPRRIYRKRRDEIMVRILERSFGEHIAAYPSSRRSDHCARWWDVCSAYVSTPSDCHGFSGTTLPFCAAKCNTNSLVAIGQEEGGVRLIDTAATADFAAVHVQFRPHYNAIMDLSFSSDDQLLATASGDQTARIIDMRSQKTTCILSGHTSSVKQIRWQPKTENVLTTSSRDGTVMIWDMRCARKGPVRHVVTCPEAVGDSEAVELSMRHSTGTLKVGPAHRAGNQATASRTVKILNSEDASVSITAFQHLSNGREHLLVTASELSASIKLWDLRTASRCQTYVPVSIIPSPRSHHQTRNYGVNSMVLSADGARLFTLCRDATVYVYSANHLALGSSSEMRTPPGRPRLNGVSQTGLGPLYALSHKELRTGSFYVKASLRQARGDKDEMLAVGSTNGCAILFPTDERCLPQNQSTTVPGYEKHSDDTTRGYSRLSLPAHEMLPRYEIGSALIRGHAKEVTSLCWTYDGDLVTIGDDMKARCWREDRNCAAQMRACGEGGGQRWGHGWAEVSLDTDSNVQ